MIGVEVDPAAYRSMTGKHRVVLDGFPLPGQAAVSLELTAVDVVGPGARFVVVDDSSRAGHTAEIPIIEFLRVVTIVLRLRGSHSTFVNRPLDSTSKVIQEVEDDENDLEQILDDSITRAERQIAALSQQYARVYPWRSPNTA